MAGYQYLMPMASPLLAAFRVYGPSPLSKAYGIGHIRYLTASGNIRHDVPAIGMAAPKITTVFFVSR